MVRMSHSLHISSGEHSISTSKKLRSVDKHNNRKFKNSNNENLNLDYSDLNATLIGSENIYNDVKNLYSELFDSSVKQFNEKQNRTKNIITSYFEKMSNASKQNLAEEVIVQFGSLNEDDIRLFPESEEDVEKIKNAYSDYLAEFQKQVPNFKIANATIHFDEANPHMHIVGVPIKENNKRGLATSVNKGAVFNLNTLSPLQTTMGQTMTKVVKDNLGLDVYHEKQAGRNKNYRAEEITEQNKIIKEQEEQIAKFTISIDQLKREEQDYNKFRNEVELNMNGLFEKNNEILKAEKRLELEEQEITTKFAKIKHQEKEFEELQADYNDRYANLLANIETVNKYEELVLEQSAEINQDIENLVNDFNEHNFKVYSNLDTNQLRIIMKMLNQENNTQVSPEIGLLGIDTSALAYKIIETKDLTIDNDSRKKLEGYYARYTEKNTLQPKVNKVEKKVEDLKRNGHKMNKHTDKIKNRFKRKNTDLEL